MTATTFTYVDEVTIESIAAIGETRRPLEACGLLMPQCLQHQPACASLVELMNIVGTVRSRASSVQGFDPSKAYEVDLDDLVAVLAEYHTLHPEQEVSHDGFFIWHTHPSGFEGPSSGDLRTRLPGFRYLVVALASAPGKRPVATRY